MFKLTKTQALAAAIYLDEIEAALAMPDDAPIAAPVFAPVASLQCAYCGKATSTKHTDGRPVCEFEWVCEGFDAPTVEDVFGDDPTGRCWSDRPE